MPRGTWGSQSPVARPTVLGSGVGGAKVGVWYEIGVGEWFRLRISATKGVPVAHADTDLSAQLEGEAFRTVIMTRSI